MFLFSRCWKERSTRPTELSDNPLNPVLLARAAEPVLVENPLIAGVTSAERSLTCLSEAALKHDMSEAELFSLQDTALTLAQLAKSPTGRAYIQTPERISVLISILNNGDAILQARKIALSMLWLVAKSDEGLQIIRKQCVAEGSSYQNVFLDFMGRPLSPDDRPGCASRRVSAEMHLKIQGSVQPHNAHMLWRSQSAPRLSSEAHLIRIH
jgi:hypothetical protein